MKPCKQVRRSFIEALYGELDPDAKQRFDDHLQSCLKCRKAFRKMKRAMGVMNQRVRVEPDQQFWDGYYGRLEKRMQQEKRSAASRWQRWVYRAAAVVLLIGAGVLMGRFWVPTQSTITEHRPVDAPIVRARLDQRTQQFLGRSEVLLLGLVNYDAETEESAGLGFKQAKSSFKKSDSGSILFEKRASRERRPAFGKTGYRSGIDIATDCEPGRKRGFAGD